MDAKEKLVQKIQPMQEDQESQRKQFFRKKYLVHFLGKDWKEEYLLVVEVYRDSYVYSSRIFSIMQYYFK